MAGESPLHHCTNHMYDACDSLSIGRFTEFSSILSTNHCPLLELMEAVFNHYPLAVPHLVFFLVRFLQLTTTGLLCWCDDLGFTNVTLVTQHQCVRWQPIEH